jgi:hypothetical protein
MIQWNVLLYYIYTQNTSIVVTQSADRYSMLSVQLLIGQAIYIGCNSVLTPTNNDEVLT